MTYPTLIIRNIVNSTGFELVGCTSTVDGCLATIRDADGNYYIVEVKVAHAAPERVAI